MPAFVRRFNLSYIQGSPIPIRSVELNLRFFCWFFLQCAAKWHLDNVPLHSKNTIDL